MTSSTPTSRHPPPRKATLYCYDCGHESPVDGDWAVRGDDDGTDYDCPECGTTITTRTRSADSRADRERVLCYQSDD